jgi:hypothetical protein
MFIINRDGSPMHPRNAFRPARRGPLTRLFSLLTTLFIGW